MQLYTLVSTYIIDINNSINITVHYHFMDNRYNSLLGMLL